MTSSSTSRSWKGSGMKASRFLIDTSAWIGALRKDGHPQVKARVADLLEHQEVYTCGMIKLALLGGTRSEEEFSRLRARLSAFASIPSDEDLWEAASKMAFRLRRTGLTIPATDVLIAESARRAEATLLHVDRHFDLLAPHIDLQVESLVEMVQ